MHAISRPPQSGHVVPAKPTPMPRIEYELASPPIPDPPQFLPHAYKKSCLVKASAKIYTNPHKIASIPPKKQNTVSCCENPPMVSTTTVNLTPTANAAVKATPFRIKRLSISSSTICRSFFRPFLSISRKNLR